ncbi:ankyrin repeat-containing protein At5g02620-like isoform X2 [Salvia miltiorrhiza]|uniref:ankyrin repeat-containing protein At5g02620-like isoform X2 n=1 Tax=Salvia miltiorrhiza TaxID=226208 RepID=UPI0025AC8188|nr:ankyrin repeat-containing protein At5g02620-like isoform X2 [Salvia miltiorrhiza]
MGCSELKYAWPCSVNVANFVTVRPSVEEDERGNFKNWKEQMVCLLESQDVAGFVDGEIVAPEKHEAEQWKLWRRTDRLVKGWILGSVGTDVLDAVRDKETARDVWLELDDIFKPQEEDEDNDDDDDDDDSDSESGEDFSKYLALYQAAMKGEWDTAKNFFEDINELSSSIISSESETVLHVAVLTGKANDLVQKLVEMMPVEALALKDSVGETALHNAATVGNTEAARALVKKNPDLLHMLSNSNRLPVLEAAINCQKETLEYLIDIALDLAHKYPNLTLIRNENDGRSALSTIAETDTLFPRTDAFTWWQKFIYHRIPIKISKSEAGHTRYVTHDIENLNSDGAAQRKYSTSSQIISQVGKKLESMVWHVIETLVPQVKEMREKKARRQQALQLVKYLCNKVVSLPENKAATIFRISIKLAAKYGISEIVEMVIHKFPMVTFHRDSDTGRNVFLLAASYRFENVINLFYNMSDRRYMFFDSTDDEKNNLLHICGKLAPSDRLNLVAGAALQLQRELQWFKEMENFVHPSRRTWTNNDKLTPQMLFTKEHEKLKADGERWMKDTANACTIAAALIATVVFAAAFTVPGGIESASGMPLLSSQPTFVLFAVSDAISLFTSITSLLMFLSILTSRYAEQDFLYVLPKRLSMGLLSLFVSITFMLVAFSATLYLVLEEDVAWFVVLVAAFASLPVTSFVLLQFPLLVDVIYSTYGPGIFGKKTNRLLY